MSPSVDQFLSDPDAYTSTPPNGIVTETTKVPGLGSHLRSYPLGLNSKLRAQLIRCEGLLAQGTVGEEGSLSRISISALSKAVSLFLNESQLGRASGGRGPASSEGSFFNRSTVPGAPGYRRPRYYPRGYRNYPERGVPPEESKE